MKFTLWQTGRRCLLNIMMHRNVDTVYNVCQSATLSDSVRYNTFSGYILYWSPVVVWVSHAGLMSLKVRTELKIDGWFLTRSAEEMLEKLCAPIHEWKGGNNVLVFMYDAPSFYVLIMLSPTPPPAPLLYSESKISTLVFKTKWATFSLMRTYQSLCYPYLKVLVSFLLRSGVF